MILLTLTDIEVFDLMTPSLMLNGPDPKVISDKDLNLYDKDIKLIFKNFIRNEKKYKSIADLTNQLRLDRNVCLAM